MAKSANLRILDAGLWPGKNNVRTWKMRLEGRPGNDYELVFTTPLRPVNSSLNWRGFDSPTSGFSLKIKAPTDASPAADGYAAWPIEFDLKLRPKPTDRSRGKEDTRLNRLKLK